MGVDGKEAGLQTDESAALKKPRYTKRTEALPTLLNTHAYTHEHSHTFSSTQFNTLYQYKLPRVPKYKASRFFCNLIHLTGSHCVTRPSKLQTALCHSCKGDNNIRNYTKTVFFFSSICQKTFAKTETSLFLITHTSLKLLRLVCLSLQ